MRHFYQYSIRYTVIFLNFKTSCKIEITQYYLSVSGLFCSKYSSLTHVIANDKISFFIAE